MEEAVGVELGSYSAEAAYLLMQDSLASQRTNENTGTIADSENNLNTQGSVGTTCDATEMETGWDAVPDLDNFLTHLYNYWFERGFAAILAKHIAHVISFGFTIFFSWWLLTYVNWRGLFSCHADACKHVSLLLPPDAKRWPLLQFVVNFYLPVFTCGLLWNIVLSHLNCLDAWTCRLYYQKRLHVYSDEALNSLEWPEVVALLLKAQKEHPFCIVQMELTALDIANVLMRDDNYVIAMTNQEIWSTHLPSFVHAGLLFTKSPLWNIRFAIFFWMFDKRSRVHADFVNRPDRLRMRFRILAILNFLLLGPILLFVIIFCFLRHADEFRSDRSRPFQREFNAFAEWTFREINELPHQLNRRLARASHHGEALVGSVWPNLAVESTKRCTKYILGALLAVLLLLGMFDEAPLLYIELWGRNLLWYTIILGTLITLIRASEIPTPRCDTSAFGMYMETMQVSQYTHFISPAWRHSATAVSPVELSATNRKTRLDFCSKFFTTRLVHMLEEVAGVVVAPYLLFFCLPPVATDICSFVRNCSTSLSVGDCCSFGTIDLDTHGCPFYRIGSSWDSDPMRNVQIAQRYPYRYGAYGDTFGDGGGTISVSTLGTSSMSTQRLALGKLEKSALSFVLHYRLPVPYDYSSPMCDLWDMGNVPDCFLSSSGSSGEGGDDEKDKTRACSSKAGAHTGDSATCEGNFGTCEGSFGTEQRLQKPQGQGHCEEGEGKKCSFSLRSKESVDKLWGYSADVEQYVYSLEQFQEEQLQNNPHLLELLPKEVLVPLKSFCPRQPERLALHRDVEASYFFWLERLFEFRSSLFLHPPKQMDLDRRRDRTMTK